MSTTASDGSILLEKEDGPEDEAVELAGEEIAGTRDSPGNSNCCASASASALASEAPAVVEAAAGRLRGRKTRHLFWYPIGMLGLAALSIAQKIGYVDLPLGFGSPQPLPSWPVPKYSTNLHKCMGDTCVCGFDNGLGDFSKPPQRLDPSKFKHANSTDSKDAHGEKSDAGTGLLTGGVVPLVVLGVVCVGICRRKRRDAVEVLIDSAAVETARWRA